MARDTAVVELEELQGIIAESQERGFLTADALAGALEDAELSSQQTHDLLSYLGGQGIEVLAAGESAPELHAHAPANAAHDGGDDSLVERAPEGVLAAAE